MHQNVLRATVNKPTHQKKLCSTSCDMLTSNYTSHQAVIVLHCRKERLTLKASSVSTSSLEPHTLMPSSHWLCWGPRCQWTRQNKSREGKTNAKQVRNVKWMSTHLLRLSASSSVKKVMAWPLLPARPVRPRGCSLS